MTKKERLEVILNTLDDLSYGDWGTNRDPIVVAAIRLLRAGAEMREAASFKSLRIAQKTWDSALEAVTAEELV